MTFEEMYAQSRKMPRYANEPLHETLVALDPGETTGVCVFKGTQLVEASQLATKDMDRAPHIMKDFLNKWKPNILVIENYQVYQWKAQAHTWNTLHTPRLIGFIEGWATLSTPPVPLIKQTAQIGKGFCTDDKLKEWGFYQKGARHARDAIRHACYFILFPSKPIIQRI